MVRCNSQQREWRQDYLYSASSFWYLSFCWQAYIEALYHAEKGEWDYRRLSQDWWEKLLLDVSAMQTIALILSLLLHQLNIALICIYRHLHPRILTCWWNAIQCLSTPVVYHSRVLLYLLHVMVSMAGQRDVAKVNSRLALTFRLSLRLRNTSWCHWRHHHAMFVLIASALLCAWLVRHSSHAKRILRNRL